ncbi:MAG: basic amino acid ABC transporter substrate-binding protein [Eubacteriales bacterium]|nr:basic amino acid ABC transporter substrate-binding protein [Eubacteriales bacterium]
MKKNLILIAAAISAMTLLSACGSKKEETSAADVSVESASAAETKAESGEKQVLTMATNAEFEPWEFHDGDDIIGIDAEVAAAIADKLGMELKIEDMAFDAVIPSIASGKCDIGMAAISVTEERKLSVDFSDSYADSALQILVKKDNTEITGVDTLEGKKIGAQNGTTGDLKASELVGDDNVERFPSYFEAVQSLKQGKIDAIIIDKAPAKAFLAQNDDIMQAGEDLDLEEYAIAIKKGNTELQEKLNKAIEELKADGTFDKIVDKYIPAE